MSNSITITDDVLKKQIEEFFLNVNLRSQAPYRKTHYRQYKKDSYFIATFFREIHTSYNLLAFLNTEESQLIDEVDLYGFLHLSYTSARDTALLNEAIINKKTLLKIHRELANYINQNAKESVGWRRLLEFNTKKETLIQNILQNLQLKIEDPLLQSFKIEYEIIIKLLSGSDKQYPDILNEFEAILLLCEKIFANQETKQIYEDAWILARALEQNPKQFYLTVDELSYISNLPLSKQGITERIASLLNNPKFEFKDNNLKLTADSIKSIENESLTLSELLKGKELNYYLKFFSFLLPNQLAALINLVNIYKVHTDKTSKVIITGNKSLAIDQALITSLQMDYIFDLIESKQEEYDDDIANIFYELKIKLDYISTQEEFKEQKNEINYLAEILTEIGNILLLLADLDVNIFQRDDLPSFMDILIVLADNFDIYSTVFATNYAEMKSIKPQSTKRFIEFIEARINMQLSILNKYSQKTAEEYVEIRKTHNDLIFDKTLKSGDLLYFLNDSQINLIQLFEDVTEQNLYELDDEQVDLALQVIDQSNYTLISNSLQKIALAISQQYSELLKMLDQKGLKDINIVTIEKDYSADDKAEVVNKYQVLQDCIFNLTTLGFKFNLTDLQYSCQTTL